MSNLKTVVHTDHAPKAVGPYSQAIKAGGWIFCSGQVALDPVTGQMAPADVEVQTQKVMQNLEAVLKAAGAGFGDVVRTTIYLKSMGDFQKVNELYGAYFKTNPPARATVEVARLPKDALVEIDAVAFVG